LKILFLGCGDIAQRTVAQLPDQYRCFGLKRNPENLPSAITPLKGDVSDYRQLQAVLAEHFDVLVATLTPDEFTEQAYRSAYLEAANSLQRALATIDRQPRWVIWVSSTSVYGDTRGAWVDEDSPTEPQTFSGRILLGCREGYSATARQPYAGEVLWYLWAGTHQNDQSGACRKGAASGARTVEQSHPQ
jgi:nucleoside-diphosphate-sugar epimerase